MSARKKPTPRKRVFGYTCECTAVERCKSRIVSYWRHVADMDVYFCVNCHRLTKLVSLPGPIRFMKVTGK